MSAHPTAFNKERAKGHCHPAFCAEGTPPSCPTGAWAPSGIFSNPSQEGAANTVRANYSAPYLKCTLETRVCPEKNDQNGDNFTNQIETTENEYF